MQNNELNSYDPQTGEVLDYQPAQQLARVETYNTGAAAAEARETAMVQARFLMALKRPRNVLQARSKILDACRRPGFAESALFRKPVGKKKNEATGKWEQQFVEGPSIRFAEEALRALGNVDIRQQVIFEDDEKRIVCVTVMDLESNVAFPTEIAISKRVERSSLKEGQKAISQRMNSWGKPVYLVEASEDEVLTKQQAQVSKSLRTSALRIVPGDILEDALNQIKLTLTQRDKADPKAALKKLVDSFQGQGIYPAELEKFLNHTLEMVTPAEIQDLRGIYQSLKDGEATWPSILAAAAEAKEEKEKGKSKGNEKPEGEPEGADATKAHAATESPAQAAKSRARGAAEKMTGTQGGGEVGAQGTLPID